MGGIAADGRGLQSGFSACPKSFLDWDSAFRLCPESFRSCNPGRFRLATLGGATSGVPTGVGPGTPDQRLVRPVSTGRPKSAYPSLVPSFPAGLLAVAAASPGTEGPAACCPEEGESKGSPPPDSIWPTRFSRPRRRIGRQDRRRPRTMNESFPASSGKPPLLKYRLFGSVRKASAAQAMTAAGPPRRSGFGIISFGALGRAQPAPVNSGFSRLCPGKFPLPTFLPFLE